MMATYTIPELWQQWKLGELSAEQALGYLLQNIVAQEQRQAVMEKRMQVLEHRLNAKS